MQSLGEIKLRTPAVGTKMWCFMFVTGRIVAKQKTAGIKFTQRV